MKREGKAMAELQYIYRLDVNESKTPDSAEVEGGGECLLFGTPWSLLRCLQGLIRAVGVVGAAKTMVKLMTPSRLFYGVMCGRDMAHYGWVTLGKCNYYPVEAEAAVIGPVETSPAFRGRGLATLGLVFVLRALAGKKCRLFYIDTAEENLPMQRVIEKCGFGRPVSSYERPEEGL